MAIGDFWGKVFGTDGSGIITTTATDSTNITDSGTGTNQYVTPDFLTGTFTGTTLILKHPFSNETRELYRYTHHCVLCGRNGISAGGVELNHIWGRVSSSPFNASLLCHECHTHIGHSREEHAKLFTLNSIYLSKIGYKPNQDDMQFIDDYVMPIYNEITTCLRSLSTEKDSLRGANTETSKLPTLE
jgi:hypothetical protein